MTTLYLTEGWLPGEVRCLKGELAAGNTFHTFYRNSEG